MRFDSQEPNRISCLSNREQFLRLGTPSDGIRAGTQKKLHLSNLQLFGYPSLYEIRQPPQVTQPGNFLDRAHHALRSIQFRVRRSPQDSSHQPVASGGRYGSSQRLTRRIKLKYNSATNAAKTAKIKFRWRPI